MDNDWGAILLQNKLQISIQTLLRLSITTHFKLIDENGKHSLQRAVHGQQTLQEMTIRQKIWNNLPITLKQSVSHFNCN
jgi:hypothetical protein